MSTPKRTRIEKNVGGNVLEGLLTEFLKQKFNATPEQILQILSEKESKENTMPLSILRATKLSSLESIVKFLREERRLSYNKISELLDRAPKALASTYTVAHRKMPEQFDVSVDRDMERIPFSAFKKELSVLECICSYLKSQGKSYSQIARLLDKDQRTVWTVCKRAEVKLEGHNDR